MLNGLVVPFRTARAIGNPLDPPLLVCAFLGLGSLAFLTALSYPEPLTTAKRSTTPMIPFRTARALAKTTANRQLRCACFRGGFTFLTGRANGIEPLQLDRYMLVLSRGFRFSRPLRTGNPSRLLNDC